MASHQQGPLDSTRRGRASHDELDSLVVSASVEPPEAQKEQNRALNDQVQAERGDINQLRAAININKAHLRTPRGKVLPGLSLLALPAPAPRPEGCPGQGRRHTLRDACRGDGKRGDRCRGRGGRGGGSPFWGPRSFHAFMKLGDQFKKLFHPAEKGCTGIYYTFQSHSCARKHMCVGCSKQSVRNDDCSTHLVCLAP